jgi:hypothetical protein
MFQWTYIIIRIRLICTHIVFDYLSDDFKRLISYINVETTELKSNIRLFYNLLLAQQIFCSDDINSNFIVYAYFLVFSIYTAKLQHYLSIKIIIIHQHRLT